MKKKKNVLEGIFFDLLRRIGASGIKCEFWPKPIFHFLGPKGGPKAAKERLGTPQGGQKCPPRRPKIGQETSKTGSGGHFCLRTCIYTNFPSFCMPKLQKNTCENRGRKRVKREHAFVCMKAPTCIFSRKILVQCLSVFA